MFQTMFDIIMVSFVRSSPQFIILFKIIKQMNEFSLKLPKKNKKVLGLEIEIQEPSILICRFHWTEEIKR